MDSVNAHTNAVKDVRDPKAMADKNCPRCYGRGVNHIILPDQVSKEGVKNVPQICDCVVKFLKKHPIELLEFLKSQGQFQ